MLSLEKFKCPKVSIFEGVFIVTFCLACFLPMRVNANRITPQQTVEQALSYSRQLKAMSHQQQAAQHDLRQSRNSYLPSVDLQLGYGVDQHSDDTTRRSNADPSDSDWDNRSNASVTLTQKLYTGGEISHQVQIRKALLESSQWQQKSLKQAVILDALTAHLDIFRHRELVELAQRNLDVHQEIYRSLDERAQAGSGNLADVSQAKARLARAQSSLYINKTELVQTQVAYARLIGTLPDPQLISYVETPANLPQNLEDALTRMEKKNPDLISLMTTLDEADARVGLAQANFKPKIDLQLSSRYSDNVEGEQSWQNTNEAMLNLRWNLFNGGQDKAAKHAAMARKMQSRSVLEDKLFELREAISATWETYQSLQHQKSAYKDAAEFSLETFEAYLSQFSVSQRSLLDILSAENDYFQSASQLVNVTVNKTIIAYHLMMLTGDLNDLKFSGAADVSDDFEWLKKRPEFTHAGEDETEQERGVAELTVNDSYEISSLNDSTNYSVEIGPCVTKKEFVLAKKALSTHNVEYELRTVPKLVEIVRLYEGSYPVEKAKEKLRKAKESIEFAFLLPDRNDQFGLYLGSFYERNRAVVFSEKLHKMGTETTLVEAQVEISRTYLKAHIADDYIGQSLIKQISDYGLTASILK